MFPCLGRFVEQKVLTAVSYLTIDCSHRGFTETHYVQPGD